MLGIDRRIAYAKRKYHSGWIWIGVIIGFAGIKLSGSLNKYGFILIKSIKIIKIKISPIKSL